ncbi:MAG: serine/threonine protein kinase [Anaerolineae bacterium]|nr:serine/threonine protein kinase [Anaerolineae bacterium]
MLEMGFCLQDRYRIVRAVGGGGMGQVYLAHDLRLADKPCAVKELLPDPAADSHDQAVAAEQFRREAATLAHLSHPNLPNVYDYFEERSRFYLVMDYIEGDTLAARLTQAPDGLPQEAVVEWAAQLCDVLAYLHAQNPPVIFRDMKPSNVMVTADGHVKLIDFGVVRLFDPAKGTDTLKMGTVGYAPPEQYAGQGQTTPRSDLYSLGVTLHELLTGVDPTAHPFVFTPPRQVNSAISATLSNAVMRAVSLDPGARFPSAQAMKETLQKATQPRRLRLPTVQRQAGTGTAVLPETAAVPAQRSLPLRIATTVGRWTMRIVIPILVALVVTAVIVSVAAAFVVASIAQGAIASADWGMDTLRPGEYIMTERAVTRGAETAVGMYAMDAISDVRVDFRVPHDVLVFFTLGSSDFSLEAEVTTQGGIPTIMLQKLNEFPLYVVGGIISGGINRGFERVWEDESLRIDSLYMTATEIVMELE